MTARMTRLERLAFETAVSWWKSKRPRGWTHKQHLDEPSVALTGHDAELAWAIARVLEAKRGEPVRAESNVFGGKTNEGQKWNR